jgi:hypothetical protein
MNFYAYFQHLLADPRDSCRTSLHNDTEQTFVKIGAVIARTRKFDLFSTYFSRVGENKTVRGGGECPPKITSNCSFVQLGVTEAIFYLGV